jgi:protein O-GlcNAc transferase
VSLSGVVPVSRVGLSLLANLGLEAWVAKTPDEYVELAIELAGDRDRLAKLRQEMRPRMKESPMMQEESFTRDLEDQYRKIWRKWCEGGNAI